MARRRYGGGNVGMRRDWVAATVVRLGAIYGRKLLDEDVKPHAKEIINAADKYGVVSQKLEAECVLWKIQHLFATMQWSIF
jgi:hypothetical protein